MEIIHKDIYEWQEPVLTEKYAYELLKEVPLKSSATYLAVAWSTLIDKLEFGSDEDKKNAKRHILELRNLKLTNAFTACQHDRFHLILPTLKEIGVSLLFASHMVKGEGYTTKDFYLKGALDYIEIDTIFLAPVFTGIPHEHKDILYSFVGSCGSKHISDIRDKIFEDAHPPNAIVIRRKGWQFDMDVYQQQTLGIPTSSVQRYINSEKGKFYQQTLTRSRFSLCPSGTGPSSIRFLESLGSGAIPVILADTMMLPKINGINWNDCIVRIPEKHYGNLRQTLSDIPLEQEEVMRLKGLEAHKLCTGKNFIKNIRDYFNGRP